MNFHLGKLILSFGVAHETFQCYHRKWWFSGSITGDTKPGQIAGIYLIIFGASVGVFYPLKSKLSNVTW
jgi:hypothetical protein